MVKIIKVGIRRGNKMKIIEVKDWSLILSTDGNVLINGLLDGISIITSEIRDCRLNSDVLIAVIAPTERLLEAEAPEYYLYLQEMSLREESVPISYLMREQGYVICSSKSPLLGQLIYDIQSILGYEKLVNDLNALDVDVICYDNKEILRRYHCDYKQIMQTIIDNKSKKDRN